MQRSGQCLCGAVKYKAEFEKNAVSACHCGMCRRWTGGPLLSAMVKEVQWEGEDKIRVFTSSDFAERAFCSECGSALFYRLTASKYVGATSIPMGTFDDQSGLELTREWFIDKKPDCYALQGDHQKTTEEQAFAMFNG